MSEYSYYDNTRDTPRISRSVFVKYDIRDENNKSVATGIATTRDLSVGGAKFLCTVPARKDYIVKLQIQLDKINQVGVIGTVAWVESLKPGQYLLGIQFYSISDAAKTKIIKFLNSYAP